MSSSRENDSESVNQDRLPRRDFLILPLLSIFTCLALIAGTETTARHFYFGNGSDSCRVVDANIGFSTRPGCTSLMKNAENSWETNQYNDCGYRSKESCGPKPLGTTRIALVGSSMSEGWFVAYDQIFATRAALELTRMLGRPVEVQNLSREQCFPICEFHRIPEALALKPDILLLAVSASDFEKLDPSQLPDRYKPIETSQIAPGAKTPPPGRKIEEHNHAERYNLRD